MNFLISYLLFWFLPGLVASIYMIYNSGECKGEDILIALFYSTLGGLLLFILMLFIVISESLSGAFRKFNQKTFWKKK